MIQQIRILNLVSEGLSPSKIAADCQLPTSTVIQCLATAINEGQLTRSEVLSTFAKDWRDNVDSITFQIKEVSPKRAASLVAAMDLMDIKCDAEELKLYISYRSKRVREGDLYEIISDIERKLHSAIKAVLVSKFGSGSDSWWRQGVPEKVRLSCVAGREIAGDYESDPYSYTTFIHLADIIEGNWGLFAPRLPKITGANQKVFVSELKRANGIRNKVMHPVREESPSEEEFAFVRDLQLKVNQLIKTKK
jgi:DNA-binding cell septation regulator SpoVG